MQHQQEILSQRIRSLQNGTKMAASYLSGVHIMLSDKEVDIESAKKEIEEIQEFLIWLSQQ